MTPPPEGISEKAWQTLGQVVCDSRYPLLFATVSGAHLYGFPSADSDFDLRGVHLLPKELVLGMKEIEETVEFTGDRDGFEIDLVTHDARKFFGLMLKKNGYVQEQLLSPLIVHSSDGFEELRDIARSCVTRHHSHHYFGFSENQWNLALKEDPPRVKPLLYVYRVLLTGIHLMRTGTFEMNLPRLNEEFRLPWLNELIRAKLEGTEHVHSTGLDMGFHRREYEHLRAELELGFQESRLPETPSGLPRLSDLLVRLRLGSGGTR